MTKKHLDIVLPCYNPPEGWTQNIIDSIRQLESTLADVNIHVILVNDGSSQQIPDEKIDILETNLSSFVYVPYYPNRGKGYALRQGVIQSEHDICIFTDIDFPYTQESILKLYEALDKGKTDVAVGIKDTSYYQHLPAFRVRISKLLRFFIRSFLRISITDTQCGLKGFNTAGKEIFLQTSIDRYLCDLEFIFLVDRQKQLVMKPIHVSLKPGVVFSEVSWRILATEGINFMKVFGRSFLGFRNKEKNVQKIKGQKYQERENY